MAQHLKSKSFSIFIHDCSMWSNLLALKSTSERGYPHIIIKGDFNYPEVEWTTSKSAEHNNQKFIDTCRDAYMYQHIQEPKKKHLLLGKSNNMWLLYELHSLALWCGPIIA